jgi:hypothetical protein
MVEDVGLVNAPHIATDSDQPFGRSETDPVVHQGIRGFGSVNSWVRALRCMSANRSASNERSRNTST